MDDTNSITLVNQLCESFIPFGKESHTDSILKKLKKLVISQLFALSEKPECPKDIIKEPVSLLKTDILSQAINSTSSGDDYNACVDKLYATIDEVLSVFDADTRNDIFTFLHHVSNLNQTKEPDQDDKIFKIPINKNNRLYMETVPYKDIDWAAFHEELPPITGSFLDYPFYKEPGEGINFFKDHITDLKMPSSNFSNLFNTTYKVWRFDVNKQVEPVIQDEGFVTPGSEFSNESIKDEDSISQTSDNCYDLDIANYKIEISNRRTWDRLGDENPPKELPFASEKTESIIHLWKIANSSQSIGFKSTPIGNQVSFEDLIIDLKYLLFGMASPSFYFNQELKIFQICDRLHTATLSPEILASLCEDSLNCANYYYSLKTFAENKLKTMLGSIHFTFCKCIQQILNIYKYALLNIQWQHIKYLSNFTARIAPLQRKLQFLTELCSNQSSQNESKFPSGVHLLDFLYNSLSRVHVADISFMLFYIFESCCNAYFRIIGEWIFDGCFSNPDNYAEFFIEIQREFELCRDWRRLTCIGIREKKVPKFLIKFYKEIYICGKSINLLKICSSKGILDKLVEKTHPDLICCFNHKQMTDYKEKWNNYKSTYEGHFVCRMKIKEKLLQKCDDPNFHDEIKRIREERLRQEEAAKIDQNEDQSSPIAPEKSENSSENNTAEFKTLENNSQSEETTTNVAPIEEPNTEPNSPETTSSNENPENNALSVIITVASPEQKDQPPEQTPSRVKSACQGAGDSIENTENKRVKHLVTLLEQKSKPANENTPGKLPKKLNMGAGDMCSPGPSEVLKEIGNVSQTEYVKNKLKSSTSYINSPQDEKPVKSKLEKGPLSACQENKLKVMSSEYHNRLNDSLNTSHEMPKTKPAILTACQENKIKVMSSEYHVRLNESLDTSLKAKPEPVKPVALSVLQENKLKVMSSEYHHRLSTSSVVEQTPKRDKPLSASEENKLKVMSSEYHIRLKGHSDGKNLEIESPRQELTEGQKNKLKVMSSEYHLRLSLGSVNTPVSKAPEEMTQTAPDVQSDPKELIQSNIEVTQSQDNPPEVTPVTDDLSKTTPENDTNIEPVAQLDKHVHFSDTESRPKFKSIFPQHLENFELKSIENVDIDSISDVDITSLTYYLAQSISFPLRIQMKLVNEAILRVFIEEECYLNHLTSLRDYLLLRKPEFTVSLTNSIFKLIEKVKKPNLLLNDYNLSSILQRALLATGSKDTITYGKKLSLFAENEIPEKFTLIDIKELECLNLSYAIEWPINILITEPIAKKYGKIFKFIMQMQRVLWVLKRDFISMKNLKQGKSIQYMKIQLSRHNMTQVVKILQEYVMREAIETCWNDLVESLTNTDVNLDVLYISHLKYVNKIIQRCFLCDLSSECRGSILNLFSLILKYHEALKRGVWRRNEKANFLYHTNFKDIDAVYHEFARSLEVVRSNLRILVYTKRKTYLETLYLELSKNAEEECEFD